MAITVPITDGKYTSDKVNNKLDKGEVKKDSSYDKDMFLQLLVAEMKYQDPMEPTDNAEYVKELAQFSQIEAVQAVEEKMQTIQANSLVGKYVILTPTVNGETQYVTGKVDFVKMDDTEGIKLSVNGEFYSMDDLDSVCDEAYYTGVSAAAEFENAVGKLPNVNNLVVSDFNQIAAVQEMYDKRSDEQKQFVDPEVVKNLKQIEDTYMIRFGNNEEE